MTHAKNPDTHVTLIHISKLGKTDRRLYFKPLRKLFPLHPVVTYLASIPVSEILEQSNKLELYDVHGKPLENFQKATIWLQDYYRDLVAEFNYMDLEETSSRTIWDSKTQKNAPAQNAPSYEPPILSSEVNE